MLSTPTVISYVKKEIKSFYLSLFLKTARKTYSTMRVFSLSVISVKRLITETYGCKIGGQMSLTHHPRVFPKKDVLKIFAKFTEKHLCRSFVLLKLQACEVFS